MHEEAERHELGIRPGADVVVIARAPFGGPITPEVDGANRLIGAELAAQVLVTAAAS